MNYSYIVVRGPLGAGKTTVASAIARRLDASYISIDSILDQYNLEEWGDTYVTLQSFLNVNIIASGNSLKLFSEGKKVVFDGNFYYKEQIDDLEEKLQPYHGLVITLKVSLEVCAARDSSRDVSYGAEAVEEVYRKATEFVYGQEIDGNGTLEETIREICTFLESRSLHCIEGSS